MLTENAMNVLFLLTNILWLVVLIGGGIAVIVLPGIWAYNVEQRGDSFGYVALTFVGSTVLIGIVVKLLLSLVEWVLKWIMFRPE
jgi:hypothetical protein